MAHIHSPWGQAGDGMKRNETEVYGEDILLGYRWFDYFNTKVRFPFGFGLSYTSFSFGRVSASAPSETALRKASSNDVL